MSTRLSDLDASFLSLEDDRTPMHVGSVMVFQPPRGGLDLDRLMRLISERITAAPRYRQKVRSVPGGLANPVWVDDERFDVTYHVRRSALPRPGTDVQLEELVARIEARPLDRSRPLWEVYLVEGLKGGRIALITKAHHALVDGVNAPDIAHLIVDGSRETPSQPAAPWRPRPTPSDVDLLVGAALDTLKAPGALVGTLGRGLGDLRHTAGRMLTAAGEVVGTLVRASASPAPASPLNASVGRARRYVMIGTDLADHKAISTAAGTHSTTVHDVVLAVLTGAFRSWLINRGEKVLPGTTVRALVPVTVADDDDDDDDLDVDGAGPGAGHGRTRITGCLIDLPVGEPQATMRLHQVAYAMAHELEGRRGVPADALAGAAGFASPTMAALGSRLGSAVSRRLANVTVTNVPGPQQPRYTAQSRMLSIFPVLPLSAGHALSVGLTSYDGGMFYGLYADREAIPDLDVLGHGIVEALAELTDSTRTPVH